MCKGEQVGYLEEGDFKGAKMPKLLFDFIKRAEDRSMRTGRADLADGVAHSYELLCTLLATDHSRLSLVQSLVESLESKVTIAEADLAQAVLLAPVHGHFASLR
jgi:multidrug resistance efflux pump